MHNVHGTCQWNSFVCFAVTVMGIPQCIFVSIQKNKIMICRHLENLVRISAEVHERWLCFFTELNCFRQIAPVSGDDFFCSFNLTLGLATGDFTCECNRSKACKCQEQYV